MRLSGSRVRSAGGAAVGGREPWPRQTARFGVLGAVPALIFCAHFFYGAALDLPALTMFAILSAALAVALIRPSARAELTRLSPGGLIIGLFAAVVAIAALTLTPAVPGGPLPIWSWAGLPPAATLNRSATIVEIIKLSGLASVFLLGCLLGARAERARTFMVTLLALGGVYAALSLILFLGGGQIAAADNRLAGGFFSPNIAGTQFGVLAMLATAWLVRRWGQAARETVVTRIIDLAPVIAVLLLFIACLLLTASRAAIVSTVAGAGLLLGWAALDNRGSRWLPMAGGGIILSCAAVLIVQGNTLFADRFGGLAEGDATREAVAAAHWRAFLDSPLFGYGLGSYPEVNNQIVTVSNAHALAVSVIQHNAYLQWLEEAGIVGALPMFALIAVILGTTAWRAFQRKRNRTLIVGLLAGSVVVLLHAAVDVSLNTPSFEAFWAMLLGIGFALSQAPRRVG